MSDGTAEFGRFRVDAEIGRGAMGVVYRAFDPLLDRVVAVKTINVVADEAERAECEARFHQEARAAGSLNHPAIVTIYDVGRSGPLAYMAMEFVPGRELRDLLAGGTRLPIDRAVEIALQVAEGLGCAHERGVVHRDIKPPNIMIAPDGRAKIMDFGIARLRSSDVQTQTGMLLGSPKYMAPELVLGQPADPRSDLFSLGVVLYEMLTGAAPFSGEDLTALFYSIVNTAPPAPGLANPAVPPMLDLVVAKALAKQPAERYQSALEFAADLRSVRAQAPAPSSGDASACHPAAMASPGASTLPLSATAPRGIDTRAFSRPARALSRAFDSSEALHRLAGATGLSREAIDERAPGQTAHVAPMETDRWTGFERLIFLAGVIITAIVAVKIAMS